MKWIRENWRASMAVGGCVMLWSGIAMIASLPATLMATGGIAILVAVLSMLPSDI